MSNVLISEKKQQVLILGKLGWPLRRIEKATGVRRETAGDYLKGRRAEIVKRDLGLNAGMVLGTRPNRREDGGMPMATMPRSA